MENLLISIIVPVFKVETYLDKCLESIVNQTYKNLEIILIDDGSPDNCPQICDKWAEKDSRIKVVHKENGGVSAARNTGIEMFTGDYVTFVDSDDWIEPYYIYEVVNCDNFNEYDIVITGFKFDYVDGKSTIFSYEDCVVESKAVEKLINDEIRPECWAKFIKRTLLYKTRFNESFGYAEDFLFNYEIFKQCTKMKCINSHKYHYLQESGNSSTTSIITENRANAYKVFEKILLDNKENPELYPVALYRFTVAVLAILSRVMSDRQITDKYYLEIVNTVLKYKKSIFKNSLISTRHKLIVLGMCIGPKLMLKFFMRLSKCHLFR